MPKTVEYPIISILGAAILSVLLQAASIGPSWANDDAALLHLIRAFYIPYLTDDIGPDTKSATDIIYPHATSRLKNLIDGMRECEVKSKGVCNLDFDVIIDGQDWTLKKLPALAARPSAGGEIEIEAKFINDGMPMEVDYYFAHVGSEWQIDDLTGYDPEEGSWRLSIILANEPQ